MPELNPFGKSAPAEKKTSEGLKSPDKTPDSDFELTEGNKEALIQESQREIGFLQKLGGKINKKAVIGFTVGTLAAGTMAFQDKAHADGRHHDRPGKIIERSFVRGLDRGINHTSREISRGMSKSLGNLIERSIGGGLTAREREMLTRDRINMTRQRINNDQRLYMEEARMRIKLKNEELRLSIRDRKTDEQNAIQQDLMLLRVKEQTTKKILDSYLNDIKNAKSDEEFRLAEERKNRSLETLKKVYMADPESNKEATQ